MSLSPDQINFINDLAERVETAESALDSHGDLAEKLDGIDALAKNFDFGSELAQLKQAMTQVFGFLGIAPEGMEEQGGMPGAAPQFAAEGGMEKGDAVVELHEHSDARKKEGMNFAAQLMPVPGGSNSAPGTVLNPKSLSKSAGDQPVTLVGVLGDIVKRLGDLEGTTGGRTSAEVTGEPVAKRAGERALFQGRF
jgi:hypothetical protein